MNLNIKMKLILVVIITLLLSMNISAKDEKKIDLTQLPKKSILISQSCTQWYLYVTLIDLDNNEMVILRYGTIMGGSDLEVIIRTGIFLDSSKQIKITGNDAPFEQPKNR